ncbi:MAG: tetratricopeptide repeat protein [Gammaproteobacteria bacterium]
MNLWHVSAVLLWVLALSAIIWFALDRSVIRQQRRKHRKVANTRYFQGLQYLLDEQPDEALTVFLKLADENPEIIEIQLAVARLFRRKGELERSIRMHQNLVARTHLDRADRLSALYELASDYVSAGLYDRAERLFNELLEDKPWRRPALLQLLHIHENQRDWEDALRAARKLEQASGLSYGRIMSHYECEMGEMALANQDCQDARAHFQLALTRNPRSVRAHYLIGQFWHKQGNDSHALKYLEQALLLRPILAPLTLPDLAALIKRFPIRGGLTGVFQKTTLTDEECDAIAQAMILNTEISDAEATAWIEKLAARHPFLQPFCRDTQTEAPSIAAVRSALEPIFRFTLRYACDECGYELRSHVWKCPSCRRWDTLVPREMIEEQLRGLDQGSPSSDSVHPLPLLPAKRSNRKPRIT